jgi:hypothetical protein
LFENESRQYISVQYLPSHDTSDKVLYITNPLRIKSSKSQPSYEAALSFKATPSALTTRPYERSHLSITLYYITASEMWHDKGVAFGESGIIKGRQLYC